MPTESRFGPSSPRYGHSTVWAHCGANGHGWPPKAPKGPKWATPGGQRGPLCPKRRAWCAPSSTKWRRGGATWGRYGGAGAYFGALLDISEPPPPPLAWPTAGACGGGLPRRPVLKRACVGEERRNLARGLATGQIFCQNPCREVLLGVVACLLVLIMGRGVW